MAATVAVIGAGAAGLAAMKCALDEGLQPTAFEREAGIGGIWRYTDDPTKSCISQSTVTNISKHLLCFSDFPIPKEFPNFLPQELFQEYFEMYAERFHLVDKIRFHTEVTVVMRSADHESTGRWTVRWRSLTDHAVKEQTFDFVMVCTGINQVPLVPNIDGLELFEGDVLHSSAYRTWKPFEGKRVLIVGMGNTGGKEA